MYWTDSGKLPETALAEILRDDAMILMQNLEMGRGSLRPNKKISYSLPALDLLECSNRFLMLHLKIARSLFYGAAKTVFFFLMRIYVEPQKHAPAPHCPYQCIHTLLASFPLKINSLVPVLNRIMPFPPRPPQDVHGLKPQNL